MAAETQVPARFWEVMNQRKVFTVFTPSKRSDSIKRTCISRRHLYGLCLQVLLAMLLQQTTTVESAVRVVQRRFRKFIRMKWHRRIRGAAVDVKNQLQEEVIVLQQRSGVADQLRTSMQNAVNRAC